MIEYVTRAAILELARKGNGPRAIARALNVSRNTVQKVLSNGVPEVPPLRRVSRLDAHIDLIRELHVVCKGNLVRVHEKLEDAGIEVGYPTLTAFCRRMEIGVKPKQRTGQYTFGPGVEMQHDTSPHTVKIGGHLRQLQCASLVMCYSRMIYAQCYFRWSRFEVRVFLTEALRTFGGAASRCMLDNSSVIIGHGTGENAVPAPAMKLFSDRFGFDFVAHELGDANRSARVERPFDYIENNFYPGRTFDSLDDLNVQFRVWCDKVNGKPKRRLKAKPVELFALEQSLLQPLPLHVPEVYDLHVRRVDVEGFVNLHLNRYSVPDAALGRTVDVRETPDRVLVFDRHRLIVDHQRQEPGASARVVLPEHRHPRRKKRPPLRTPEEELLRAAGPEFGQFIDALRKRYGGNARRRIPRLHRLYIDYPTDAVRHALTHALQFDLLDLQRIERMVLRNVAGDFFRLPTGPSNNNEDQDDG